MLEALGPLAERIRESRERVAENAAAIRAAGRGPRDSDEASLILRAGDAETDFSVCAVDGGLLADRLVGSDIVVRRSVAVNLMYGHGKLASTHYHPKKFPGTEVDFRTGLDEHEALLFRSLFRLRGEISCAIGALERFRPDYLLLDGSVVLLGSDRPGEGSPLSADYVELLRLYKSLYGKCEGLGCQLVGVIKDSRGKRLAETLGDQLIVDVPDAVLADALLQEGERTAAISYSTDASRHQVLRSLGEWGGKVKLFYIKPSASDIPLRIEFMQSQKKNAGEIAAAILALSSISKAFAYPAALIEADMCAALDPLEMDKVKRSLFVLTGGASKPLRRAQRPFR